jgi:hypothetical protein
MIRGGFLSKEGRAHLEALVRRPSERHGVARAGRMRSCCSTTG